MSNQSVFTVNKFTHQLQEKLFSESWIYIYGYSSPKSLFHQKIVANSIHTLVYHMNYYVREFSKVLKGDPLAAQDLLSFASVSPKDQQEWETMKQQVFEEARAFIPLIESFDEKKLGNLPGDPAWGDYYRNLQGIVEHNHYHLGQIVLIKKLLRSNLLT